MPRDRRLRARPQTDGTKTSGRFGPFAPMRGARGQAEAIQQGVYRPVMPTEGRLQPAGRSYALTYHGYNKLRDWD